MGCACAAAAARRKHSVVLISGPVELAIPKSVELIRVISAEDMQKAVLEHFDSCDCVIMTAAVCDYRPRRKYKRKITKTAGGMSLKLVPTKDILAQLGRAKVNQLLIGFALQDYAGRRNGRRKLIEKRLDAIVLNSPAALGADRLDAEILRSTEQENWQSFKNITKAALAGNIVTLAENIAAAGTKLGA